MSLFVLTVHVEVCKNDESLNRVVDLVVDSNKSVGFLVELLKSSSTCSPPLYNSSVDDCFIFVGGTLETFKLSTDDCEMSTFPFLQKEIWEAFPSLSSTSSRFLQVKIWWGAKKSDVFVLGDSIYGSCGIGNSTRNVSNIADKIVALQHETVVKMACGFEHCITLCNSRRIYVWGYNGFSQLGPQNIWGNSNSIPQDITGKFQQQLYEFNQKLPLEEKSIPQEEEVFVDVFAGFQFSLVLTSHGNIISMGANSFGQMGMGTLDSEAKAVPYVNFELHSLLVKIGSEQSKRRIAKEQIDQVSVGGGHVVILTKSGRVIVYGSNAHGQLGESGVDILGVKELSTEFATARIVQVVASRSASFFLMENGELFSCGRETKGEVGRTKLDRAGPFQMIFSEPVRIRAVFSGPTASCSYAISDKFEVFTWGDTPTELFKSPTKIMDPPSVNSPISMPFYVADITVGWKTLFVTFQHPICQRGEQNGVATVYGSKRHYGLHFGEEKSQDENEEEQGKKRAKQLLVDLTQTNQQCLKDESMHFSKAYQTSETLFLISEQPHSNSLVDICKHYIETNKLIVY